MGEFNFISSENMISFPNGVEHKKEEIEGEASGSR